MSDEALLARIMAAPLPDHDFATTANATANLLILTGTTVVYLYPRTSPPDSNPIEGWDAIPGARGCTPQSCAFRDHYSELKAAGADHVFGCSSQSVSFQTEMAERLHLPFPIISDEALVLKDTLMLPTFEAGGMELYKRLTLVLQDGKIVKVFYPVTKPDENATDVLTWLKSR